MTAAEIIEALGLAPHPEGGHYVETWRGPAGPDGRAVGTAIYYLLRQGERSWWHRVDATELWLYHAGSPLALDVKSDAGAPAVAHVLGAEVTCGERPQVLVEAGAWQSAVSLGPWTLVSCTVAPGFRFEGFELAPPDWPIPS